MLQNVNIFFVKKQKNLLTFLNCCDIIASCLRKAFIYVINTGRGSRIGTASRLSVLGTL